MENRFCAVSELHRIRLAEEYWQLLDEPGKNDFTLHTLSTKEAMGQKTMLAELVIAGKEAREKYPLAEQYPVHFKKTYMPGALHRDTEEEFSAMETAARILGSPGPIGRSPHTVRSCFIPGKTLERLTPLRNDPPGGNVQAARKMPELQLFGLWDVLQAVFAALEKLHAEDFFHRDMELHNCTVCPSPAQVFLIDFGASSFAKKEEDRQKLRFKDHAEIFRQAIYVQTALGPQPGALGEQSRKQVEALFQDGAYFQRRFEER